MRWSQALLLLTCLCCGWASAAHSLVTYELGKRWNAKALYPPRRTPESQPAGRARMTRVNVLEKGTEALLTESRERLKKLAERLHRQRRIDAMMDTLLGVRRMEAK